MTKDRLWFRHLVVSSLTVASVCAAFSARAVAASGATEKPKVDDANRPGVRNPSLPFAGQLSSLFRINDAEPESSVPTATQRDGNPLEFGYFLQDLMARAEEAGKKNDRQAKIRYLRALAAAVPNEAKGWGLLCEEYEKAGERQRAIGACKYAIDREGVDIKDFGRFVHLVASKEGDLDNDERSAVNEVLAHLDKDPNLAVPAAQMRCEVAVKMKDGKAMEACTGVLAKLAPDDPKTLVFQWSLAMMRGQREDARLFVARAKVAGLQADAVDRMNDLMAKTSWAPSRLVGFGALGTVAAVLLFLLLRRRLEARRLGGGVASSQLPSA